VTHVAVPPSAAVSADGSRVAVPTGSSVQVVHASGPSKAPQAVDVGHQVAGVALDETGTVLAAWGEGRLSVAAVDGSALRPVALESDQRVTRLRVLRDSLVAVVADQHGLGLRTWSSSDLAAAGSGPRWSDVEVDGLLTAGHRAVLWGRQGTDLDFSAGIPWLRVCELSDLNGQAWQGEGLKVALNGVVYPVADGHLGVHTLDAMVELAERGGDWLEVRRRPWDGYAQSVSSADGSHVATLGSRGDEDAEVGYLRVTRMDGDATVAYAETDPIGPPPALAVANDARATVAYVDAAFVLHILTLTGSDLFRQSTPVG
jgi:hypothetical protein